MSNALVVVDVQLDFCEGGSLGVDGGNLVASKIASQLTDRRGGYDHVVATRDHHIDPGSHVSDEPDFVDSWPPHCVVGTPGQQLHPDLTGIDFDAIFDKGSYEAAYSGFEGSIGGDEDGERLADWLRSRGVTRVDVVGIATDFCVRATALDSAREGFTTGVFAQLTAAVLPARVPEVFDELRAAGVSIH